MQNNMHIHFTIHIAFNKIDTSIKFIFFLQFPIKISGLSLWDFSCTEHMFGNVFEYFLRLAKFCQGLNFSLLITR